MQTGGDCFITIARQAGISFTQLDALLKILQNLKLIKYSWQDMSIELLPEEDEPYNTSFTTPPATRPGSNGIAGTT